MKKYILKLKHDNGIINILTVASSKTQAIKMICNAENCTEKAIINIIEKSLL